MRFTRAQVGEMIFKARDAERERMLVKANEEIRRARVMKAIWWMTVGWTMQWVLSGAFRMLANAYF